MAGEPGRHLPPTPPSFGPPRPLRSVHFSCVLLCPCRPGPPLFSLPGGRPPSSMTSWYHDSGIVSRGGHYSTVAGAVCTLESGHNKAPKMAPGGLSTPGIHITAGLGSCPDAYLEGLRNFNKSGLPQHL